MVGGISSQRPIPKNETKYLDALVRGVYAKENLKKGLVINSDNFSKYFYLAIPLIRDSYLERFLMEKH